MLPLTARSLPALVLLFSPPPPLVSSAPAPLSPYLSLFLSLFFFTILCLLQPAHSLCSSRVMRRKRKKKGGGIGVKSRGRFLLVQSQALPPVSASFVCSGCCSGDMAAGFDPDCGNISSVAESGIAGKDNENRWEKERREREGGEEGGGQRGGRKGWISLKDLAPHTYTLYCCNACAHIIRFESSLPPKAVSTVQHRKCVFSLIKMTITL